MSNFDTPQLKLVKDYWDAYCSLDINNIRQYQSKDFKYQTFPNITEIPDQGKEAHTQFWGPVLSLLTKEEVRAQNLGPSSSSRVDIRFPQIVYHEVFEAPGKVIIHVCPSAEISRVISGHNTWLLPRQHSCSIPSKAQYSNTIS
jgi:hypothetical protein